MKRFLLLVVVLFLIAFSGCRKDEPCTHEFSVNEYCVGGMSCSKCYYTIPGSYSCSVPELSCNTGGICTRCGMYSHPLGHKWVDDEWGKCSKCTTCGASATLPEVTKGEMMAMPDIKDSIQNVLGAYLTEDLENEIDTTMAMFQAAYDRYLSTNDADWFYKTVKIISDNRGYVTELLSDTVDVAANADGNFSEDDFSLSMSIIAFDLELTLHRGGSENAAFSRASQDPRERSGFETVLAETIEEINIHSQFYYGIDLIESP